MIQISDKQDCCGCHACYNICPKQCIGMQIDDEGFWYPVVAIDTCSECGLCEQACPILNINVLDNNPIAYACINKDDKVRQQSSSGGMFTAIVETVIANNGVVFGAGFDDDFNVVHSWTDKTDGLSKFRGSKYVQSCIGDTYKEVWDFLQQGRQVVFSGTPCQIAGLRSYLARDYEALFCLDIICHGVPSPMVWDKYRREVTKNKELNEVNFRDKTYGWNYFSLEFKFCNGEFFKELGSENKYVQGFLKDIYLRPSCYNCHFKTLNRQSDLTLADFWGIENIIPSFNDDRGTSLVIINSEKGRALFSSISDVIDYQKVDLEKAIMYNPAAIKSVNCNHQRDKFFKQLNDSADIIQLIAKYTKISFSRKLYTKVRALPSKIKRAVSKLGKFVNAK